ncbi:MAG: GNAT family N-acetyltransferase [Rhodocyclales bacterium]|nr:GNAT family N-acetyltransferase [Rhodocyclales bacterium]
MSTSQEIITRRLTLAPFAEQFLTRQYVSWLNDPDVVRYSTQRHRKHTLESCRDYWQSYAGTPHHFWAIVEHGQGLGHIGNLNAHVDPHDKVADIGILIGNKEAWRQGYASEAWLAVCRYLFTQAGMRKITAGTCASNAAMLALMNAAGMVEDGRRSRQTLVDGREDDIVYAALFKDSWNPRSVDVPAVSPEC